MPELEPLAADGAAPSSQHLRAADGDRDEVAERLRLAAAEGRLDTDELVDRLGRAYAAKTFADLEAVLADLTSEPLVLETTSANLVRSGRWRVPRRIVARCTTGLVRIDFSEALAFHRETYVEATCGAGWITLIVPPGWCVDIDAASTNTGHLVNRATGPATAGAPRLTVIAHPGLGYVRIKRAG